MTPDTRPPDLFRKIRREVFQAANDLPLDLALSRGYVTADQLDAAMREAGDKDVLDVLLRQGALKPEQFAELRKFQGAADMEALSSHREDLPPEVVLAQRDPQNLLDRYVLVGELGRGGIGTVWKAWDGRLHRWVAIKVPHQAISPTMRDRFARERRILADLRHPNLVAVHDAGEFMGRPFIVMELIPGKPLDRAGDFRWVAEIIRKVALAMEAVHARGVIHRDLKPGNILLDDSGEPRILDFGLAQQVGVEAALTQDGAILGTPHYMAPEQIKSDGQALDARTDLYALGAVFYQLLTGQMPSPGASQHEVFDRILNEEPRAPSNLDAKIPADLEAICLKALEKNRDDRYPSARALAEDLDRYLKGDVVHARPASWPRRMWKRVRRRPGAWVGGLVACLLLAGTVGVARRFGDYEKSREMNQWSRELSTAYNELSLTTSDAMRRLEDRWQTDTGQPVEPDLAQVENHVRSLSDRFPRLRLPKAWRGMAYFFAGREREASVIMGEARQEAGEDPFPDALTASLLLTSSVRKLHPSIQVTSGDGVLTFHSIKLEGLDATARDQAVGFLDKAMKSRAWKELDHGKEFASLCQGLIQLLRRDYAPAVKSLERAAEYPILQGQARLLQGVALFLLDRPREAAAAWERLADRHWSFPTFHAGLAHFSLAHGRDTEGATAAVEIAAAWKAFDETIRLDPACAAAWQYRALASADRGVQEDDEKRRVEHFDRAVQDCEQAGLVMKGAIEFKLQQAMVFTSMARAGPATIARYSAAFQRSIALLAEVIGEHDSPAARYLRGGLLLEVSFPAILSGKHAGETLGRAVEDFDQAIALGDSSAGTYLNRGRALCALADFGGSPDPDALYERALVDFDKVVTALPDNSGGWARRGYYHLRMAERRKASSAKALTELELSLADLDRCLGLQPSIEAYVYRAQAKRLKAELTTPESPDQEGLWRDSILDFNRAVELQPSNPAHRFARGQIYLKLAEKVVRSGGDPSDNLRNALEDLNESLKLREDVLVLAQRGFLLEKLKRREDAIRDYERVLELQPDLEEVRRRLEALKR